MNATELELGAQGILKGPGFGGMLGGSPGEQRGQPEHRRSRDKGIVGRNPE